MLETKKAKPVFTLPAFFLGSRSQEAFEKAAVGECTDGKNNVFHLADLGLVGWRFPNDPAMPWLKDLMNKNRVSSILPMPDASDAANQVSIEIVNYRPEIRCTARYAISEPSGERKIIIYGKTFADQQGQLVQHNIEALLSELKGHAQCFILPKPLAYDAVRRTLWLSEIKGTPLITALMTGPAEPLLNRLGFALAKFHQAKVTELPAITPLDYIAAIHKKADKMLVAHPDIKVPLNQVLSCLVGAQPNERQGLIHGDFHINQLAVLPDQRLALFDFDELAFGNPLLDLANFTADLYNQNLPMATVDSWLEIFFAAYHKAAPKGADIENFIWYLRGQLLTRAYRAHIQQINDTGQRINQLIRLALRPWQILLKGGS